MRQNTSLSYPSNETGRHRTVPPPPASDHPRHTTEKHQSPVLKSLIIKNYALIDDLEAQFEPGFNILTGETGAGKSIIIDALSPVLGERPDAGAVRAVA